MTMENGPQPRYWLALDGEPKLKFRMSSPGAYGPLGEEVRVELGGGALHRGWIGPLASEEAPSVGANEVAVVLRVGDGVNESLLGVYPLPAKLGYVRGRAERAQELAFAASLPPCGADGCRADAPPCPPCQEHGYNTSEAADRSLRLLDQATDALQGLCPCCGAPSAAGFYCDGPCDPSQWE